MERIKSSDFRTQSLKRDGKQNTNLISFSELINRVGSRKSAAKLGLAFLQSSLDDGLALNGCFQSPRTDGRPFFIVDWHS